MSDPAAPNEGDFREEVDRLRGGERRRIFPVGVHVGVPAGVRRRLEVPWPVPQEYDAGLSFDLLDALVDELVRGESPSGHAWTWLTRPGVPEVHDCDLGWLAAARRAFCSHGLALAGFRTVTRTGWLDPVTGESRTFKRPRR
jgi:hypothetical protein